MRPKSYEIFTWCMYPRGVELDIYLDGVREVVYGTRVEEPNQDRSLLVKLLKTTDLTIYRQYHTPRHHPELMYMHWGYPTEQRHQGFMTRRGEWLKYLHSRFSNAIVKTMLRSCLVLGLHFVESYQAMQELYDGANQFNIIHANWLQYRKTPTLDEMVRLIAQSNFTHTFLPAIRPLLLEREYGYTQEEYVQDLSCYWDDIEPVYFQAWDTTRIGMGSIDTSAISEIGQKAMDEMNQISKLAQMWLTQGSK